MAWTSLAAEQTLLDDAAASANAEVALLGSSVEGRPIRAVAFGPGRVFGVGNRADLLLTGCVHGNEPAGREAQLEHIASWIAAPPAFLSTLTIVIVPTVNPDGFEASNRQNANEEDLNRDWMRLTQRETQVVAPLLGDRQPYLVIDQHEFWGPGRPPIEHLDIAFAHSQMFNASEDIIDLGRQLRDQLIADSAGHGHAAGVFATGRRSLNLLDQQAPSRHGAGLIIESRWGGEDPPTDTERLTVQRDAIDDAITWLQANVAALHTASDAQRDAQVSLGELRTPYALLNAPALDPAPLKYRLSALQLSQIALQLDAFNIDVGSGNTVTMAQEARLVIGHLMDPRSTDGAISAIPLSTVQASVQQLAEIVSGSHRVVVAARVLSTFQIGDDPLGVDIPVLGGDVRYDSTARIYATLNLDTLGVSETDGRTLFPRRAGDLLAPYGTEIFVRRGIDVGDVTLWVPLGYFRIDDVEQSPASDGTISISASDRMVGLDDGELLAPLQFRSTRTIASVVEELVHGTYPAATILFDDEAADEPLGRQMIVEKSRYDALLNIVESLGKIMYWDGEGVLRIEDAPESDEIVWEIRAGHEGVLVDVRRRVTREGMANAIVATGEGSSGSPMRGVAFDNGPNSPTRWDPPDDPTMLWFGQIPDSYSSPLITTPSRARHAARNILRRRIGMPYQIDFGVIPNPALRPRHLVRVTQKDGNRERHLMETVTVPLNAASNMTGGTREQTQVRIETK